MVGHSVSIRSQKKVKSSFSEGKQSSPEENIDLVPSSRDLALILPLTPVRDILSPGGPARSQSPGGRFAGVCRAAWICRAFPPGLLLKLARWTTAQRTEMCCFQNLKRPTKHLPLFFFMVDVNRAQQIVFDLREDIKKSTRPNNSQKLRNHRLLGFWRGEMSPTLRFTHVFLSSHVLLAISYQIQSV